MDGTDYWKFKQHSNNKGGKEYGYWVQVLTVARQTVWVIVKTSVPVFLVSMIVGLVISLFQTLTSIQEQTLTFVPKTYCNYDLTLMILGKLASKSDYRIYGEFVEFLTVYLIKGLR